MLTRRRLLLHDQLFPKTHRQQAAAVVEAPDTVFWQAIHRYGLTSSSSHDIEALRALFAEIGEAAFAMSAIEPRMYVPTKPLSDEEISRLAADVRELDRQSAAAAELAATYRKQRRRARPPSPPPPLEDPEADELTAAYERARAAKKIQKAQQDKEAIKRAKKVADARRAHLQRQQLMEERQREAEIEAERRAANLLATCEAAAREGSSSESEEVARLRSLLGHLAVEHRRLLEEAGGGW